MSRGPSRVPFSTDGVFARVLASLPTPLVLALRESELDVATKLRDCLRMNAWELQALMTEEGYTCEQDSGGLVAPSGAASSTHSSLACGQSRPVRPVEWVESKGGDPRTDHATLMTGGDPKTDHAFLGETGGDPKTDLAICCAGAFSVDSGSSPRKGGLASQTATPVLLDLPDFASFMGPELRNGLPSSADMEKTTTGGGPVDLDGFTELATPKTAAYSDEKKLQRNCSSNLEVTNDPISTDFAPFPRIGKKSECHRQFSAEVSGHPESELSAHQMPGVHGHSGTTEHRPTLPEHSDQSMGPSVYTALQKQPTIPLEQVDLNESEGCSTKERNSERRRRVRKEYAKQKPKDSTGNTPNEPEDVIKVNSSFSASQHGTSSTMSSISIAAMMGDENVQQNVQATDRHEVETKHCEDIEIFSGWYDKVPDFVLFYFTLVSDRAIPSGYLEQFIALEQPIWAAAERADRRNPAITNFSAAQWLHRWKKSEYRAQCA